MNDPAKLPPLRPSDFPSKPVFYEAIRRTRRLEQITDPDFRKYSRLSWDGQLQRLAVR